jgi:hypothetical protein
MPQSVGPAVTRPVASNETWFRGARVRVRAPSRDAAHAALPKLAPDLAWAFKGVDAPDGRGAPWHHFKVVLKADLRREDVSAALDSIKAFDTLNAQAITKMTVASSAELPPAAPGYSWQLLNVFNMVPRKFSYGLVADAR